MQTKVGKSFNRSKEASTVNELSKCNGNIQILWSSKLFLYWVHLPSHCKGQTKRTLSNCIWKRSQKSILLGNSFSMHFDVNGWESAESSLPDPLVAWRTIRKIKVEAEERMQTLISWNINCTSTFDRNKSFLCHTSSLENTRKTLVHRVSSGVI